ncbi:MAG TPA: hypothetical protein VNH38_04810 [Candidatus Dormibacteraeota bacterium]|nr:hypothetical protein [Candidatus Dormibacteraeota bacterium]
MIDAYEPEHDLCRMVGERIALPLVSKCPAFTEAMYLRSRAGGQLGQDVLSRLLLSRGLELADLPQSTLERSSVRMTKSADLPVDLADANLVALAEEGGDRRVFTLATDFHVYQLPGRHQFEIVPSGG